MLFMVPSPGAECPRPSAMDETTPQTPLRSFAVCSDAPGRESAVSRTTMRLKSRHTTSRFRPRRNRSGSWRRPATTIRSG